MSVKNLILLLSALILTLLTIEVCLPLVIRVTDRIDYDYQPGPGQRLAPDQSGCYIRDGVGGSERIEARFHINNAGFNNLHHYSTTRPPLRTRIAVVGDSFVEAFQVNPEESFSRVLEQSLQSEGYDLEIYSFGVSGYGTSQILHLVNEVVLPYEPDGLIYLFVQNDVTDSTSCHEEKVLWTQKYDLDPEGNLIQLPLEPYEIPTSRRWIRQSRLFRFLFYQRRLKERLIAKQEGESDKASDISSDPCSEKAWRIVERLIVKLNRDLKASEIPWVLVWQGDSDPDYYTDTRVRLQAICERNQIPFLDPSPWFAADFAERGLRFRIKGDGHWNANGHRVAARALSDVVKQMIGKSHSERLRHSPQVGPANCENSHSPEEG